MDRTLDTSRLMKPVRFAHFVLRVTDLKASIDFYQRLLGMHVVHEASFIAFMTYDEEHHRIALVATPVTDPAPPGAAGLDHVAYTFASLEELLGNYLRLKSLGLVPVSSGQLRLRRKSPGIHAKRPIYAKSNRRGVRS
jgi:catechol 2,3-dioxygenase-like lactoylglutathione lyase family enzyme